MTAPVEFCVLKCSVVLSFTLSCLYWIKISARVQYEVTALLMFQVSFEGDPEAALVTYSSNAEAAACYRSSEPVFNNRFIKVFWHNKEKQEATNSQVNIL